MLPFEPIGGKPLVSVMISEKDLQHRPHQHESPTSWLNINSKKGYPSGKLLYTFGKIFKDPRVQQCLHSLKLAIRP